MKQNNGGPAFPGTYNARSDQGRGAVRECHDTGMTLRDYFAAKASDGDIGEIMGRHFDYDQDDYTISRQQARYIHADAMLAAREA